MVLKSENEATYVPTWYIATNAGCYLLHLKRFEVTITTEVCHCTVGQPNFGGIFQTNSINEFDPNRDSITIFGSL